MTVDNEKVFHESHDSHQNHENHQHHGDTTISYSRKPSSRMKTCKNINCLMAITRELGSRLLFDRNLCMFFCEKLILFANMGVHPCFPEQGTQIAMVFSCLRRFWSTFCWFCASPQKRPCTNGEMVRFLLSLDLTHIYQCC